MEHKKTFYFLEQLLLAKRMQDQVLDIDIQRDGMDLYFGDKASEPTSFMACG